MADVSKINELFRSKLIVANVGPKSFATALEEQGYETVQINWKPLAAGDTKMQQILSVLGY